MEYYVRPLNKFFDTEAEANEAENKYMEEQKAKEEKKAKLAKERDARADEIKNALKEVKEAEKKYWDLRNAFIKDYGYFNIHYINNDKDSGCSTFFEEFCNFF